MVVGRITVLLVHGKDFSQQVKSFFEGMGYGYMNVISLIVPSSCFIAGMTATGLTDSLVQLVSGTGAGGKIASGVFPGALGVISGSGIGPSVALSQAGLPPPQDNPPLALDL